MKIADLKEVSAGAAEEMADLPPKHPARRLFQKVRAMVGATVAATPRGEAPDDASCNLIYEKLEEAQDAARTSEGEPLQQTPKPTPKANAGASDVDVDKRIAELLKETKGLFAGATTLGERVADVEEKLQLLEVNTILAGEVEALGTAFDKLMYRVTAIEEAAKAKAEPKPVDEAAKASNDDKPPAGKKKP